MNVTLSTEGLVSAVERWLDDLIGYDSLSIDCLIHIGGYRDEYFSPGTIFKEGI